MGAVTGNNLMIFTGRDMDVIGCEASCTLEIVETDVLTTTKGSGRGTSREYGKYDATLTSNGVIFIYDTENNSATGNKTDVTFMLGYMLKGYKVAARFNITDGSTTKFVYANWVISSITFAGTSGEHATYDMTLKLDGELYYSSNINGDGVFDGAAMLRYIYSGAGAFGFNNTSLVNADKVHFVVKNGMAYDSVAIIATAITLPSAGSAGFHAASGTINFATGDSLVDGDIVYVSYDPA